MIFYILLKKGVFMKPVPRDNLSKIKPYQHGKSRKELLEELEVENIIKLSSNENPLGLSPKSKVAIQQAIDELHIYPEVASTELVKALAKKFNFPVENIITGSGATDIIVMISLAYLNEGEEVISGHPSFIMYGIATDFMGGEYIKIPLKNYTFSLQDIQQAITDKTKIIYICNPNNPTGTIVRKHEWDKFLSGVPDNILVVIDEAYFDFVDDPQYPDGMDYVKSNPNLIVLRTFSKNYGLAGLRVGFAIGNEEIIQNLYRVKKPFNVTHLSQIAAIAALEDEEFLKRTTEHIIAERDFLSDEFEKLNINFAPSQSNFFYLVFNSEKKANEIYTFLQKEGILTRPMNTWGDPRAIRITIGNHSDNVRLIRFFKEIL
jgi:histidinol-phosphate aminotransferase